MDALLDQLAALPAALIYLLLGAGAALENIFPPIPADTFVVLGGFLSSRIGLSLPVVMGVTWAANATSALIVYGVGRRLGPAFFERGLGRFLLNSGQLGRMRRFYARWGVRAIFFTRFLPGLRAIVPGFAGVVGESFPRVALPLTLASAIWYGGLAWIGALAGDNLDRVLTWLGGVNRGLLIFAGLIFIVVGIAWYRTRHMHDDEDETGRDDEAVDP